MKDDLLKDICTELKYANYFRIIIMILVMIIAWVVVSNAEPTYYTPWLAFTNDADRERQIDSVGTVVDSLLLPTGTGTAWYRDGEIYSKDDSAWFKIHRQIAFVEIKVWPHSISIQSPMILGTFRVAWKEER